MVTVEASVKEAGQLRAQALTGSVRGLLGPANV